MAAFISVLALAALSSCAGTASMEERAARLEGGGRLVAVRLDAAEDRISELDRKLESANKKLAELSMEASRLAEEKAELLKRLEKVEEMTGAPSPGAEDMAEAVGEGAGALTRETAAKAPDAGEKAAAAAPLRIKILSGVSDPAPAAKAAEELRKLGYKPGPVDRAAKPFQKTTVFYSERAFSDALKIANIFEGVLKPLTWESEFDLIVVVVESNK